MFTNLVQIPASPADLPEHQPHGVNVDLFERRLHVTTACIKCVFENLRSQIARRPHHVNGSGNLRLAQNAAAAATGPCRLFKVTQAATQIWSNKNVLTFDVPEGGGKEGSRTMITYRQGQKKIDT